MTIWYCQVKQILNAMRDVEVFDEIVCCPGQGGGAMRMKREYASKCQLVRTNSRIIVAWKGPWRARPRGDRPHMAKWVTAQPAVAQ